MHIKTFRVKALFDQIGKEHTQKDLPHHFSDFLNTKADFFCLAFLIEKWGTASKKSCLSQSQEPSLQGGFLPYHGLSYCTQPGSANAAFRANKMKITSAHSESTGEEDELQICRTFPTLHQLHVWLQPDRKLVRVISEPHYISFSELNSNQTQIQNTLEILPCLHDQDSHWCFWYALWCHQVLWMTEKV